MPTIAERQQQRGGAASPRVEEYRHRLQRTKRIRRSRAAVGTTASTSSTSISKPGKVLDDFGPLFVPGEEESPVRVTHRASSFVCGAGGAGVRGNHTKNRARRVRPKSAPRGAQATAHVPLAAERFRDTSFENAAVGNHNDPHTRERRRRQHTATSPPAFPPGKLNEVALAQQRRKLDRLAQLEFGQRNSSTSTATAAAASAAANNNNNKDRTTAPSKTSSAPSKNKQQQRQRSQSVGPRKRPESGAAPLLREPSFLASSPAASPTPSQQERGMLGLAPAMRDDDDDDVDFHARSGTGFLACRPPRAASPGAARRTSAERQEHKQKPAKRTSEQQQQQQVHYDRESGMGFQTTTTTAKATPKAAPAARKPPLEPRGSSNHRSSTSGTEQSSAAARGRRPPRTSRSDVQQLRRRSHSSSSVGRLLNNKKSRSSSKSNKHHPRRQFRDDNSIEYYRDDECNGDDDFYYDDDEDETYCTITHHHPAAASGRAPRACGAGDDMDPCSSDNLRRGIRAGQGVAERLSSCIALAVAPSSPGDDDDRDFRRHHSRHNTSRSSGSRKSRPRAVDDNDAYFVTVGGGTATGSSGSSHHKKQPRPRAMDDNDAFFAANRAAQGRSWDNSVITRSRSGGGGGGGGSLANNNHRRGNVSDDNCLVGRRELTFDDNFDKKQQQRKHKTDQYVVDENDACSIVESLSRISHESDGDTSSFWGPTPAPPAPALPVEGTTRQQPQSDRDLIGPPQILKIARFDQQSPTSVLHDPFAAAAAAAASASTKPARSDEAMSALTYSPDRHGSPPRRPQGSYEDKLSNKGGNDCNNNNNKNASSTPWDESSTQRRQQLLQPFVQTQNPDAKPFDEPLAQNRGRPPVSPSRLRSLVDSSVSSGRPSPSGSILRKTLEQANKRQNEQQPPQQQKQSTTTPPGGTPNAVLRGVRMELFRRENGGASGSPTRSNEKPRRDPEGVPSESTASTAGSDRQKHDPLPGIAGRTLDNIQRDKDIAKLQEKVKESGAALEHTKRELEISRAEMTKRSQAFEEASASIFRERMDVEEKLRQEMKSNEQFKRQMQELQKEVSRLGNAIGNTDVTGKADGETARAVERLSADLLSLRSEVVDLRSQLAEAQAASLAKDKEIDKLRYQRDDAQSQLSGLNQKIKRLEREAITLRAKATVSGQQEKDVAIRYEEEVRNLQVALEEANREVIEQAEKKKHLERDLSEVQIATMKYAAEVEGLKNQMEKTREAADEKVSAGDTEARRLQNELREIKEKLSQTNSEIINQAAAHLKEKGRLQSELEQTRKVAEVLQSKVSNMDQELAETLEENEKQRSVIDEGSRAGARNSPAVFIDILRKTLDQTRAQQSSPSD